MNKKYTGIFALLTVFALNISLCVAQDTLDFEAPELSIGNDRFLAIVDSLLERERGCKHFDSSYIWTVEVKRKKDCEYNVSITYGSGIPPLYGFFYIGSIVFFVDGDHLDDVFSRTETVREFNLEYNSTELPPPEDHSLWIYRIKNGKITLKEAYVGSCQ